MYPLVWYTVFYALAQFQFAFGFTDETAGEELHHYEALLK